MCATPVLLQTALNQVTLWQLGDFSVDMIARDDDDARLRAEIAARLRELCRAIERAENRTQSEVGQAVGAEPAAWSLYLKGDRRPPYALVVAIWKRFGAEPAWLLAGEERHNDPIFQAKLDELRRSPDDGRPRRGRPPSRT